MWLAVIVMVALFFFCLGTPGYRGFAVIALVAVILIGAGIKSDPNPDPERPQRPEWMDRKSPRSPATTLDVVKALAAVFIGLPAFLGVFSLLWFVPLYGMGMVGRLFAWLFH